MPGNFERETIEALIKSKLNGNYIYNLHYNEYNVMKFNILIEVERPAGFPARLLAALEYIPSRKCLRVITLY